MLQAVKRVAYTVPKGIRFNRTKPGSALASGKVLNKNNSLVGAVQQELKDVEFGDKTTEISIDAPNPDELASRLKEMGFEDISKHMEKTVLESLDSKKLQHELQNSENSMETMFEHLLEQSQHEVFNWKKVSNNKDRSNTEMMLDVLDTLIKVPDGATQLPLEKLVEAFEVSKLIPHTALRFRGLFLSGSLIYSLKRVTMDPVNESFFVDALVYFKRYNRATKLMEKALEKQDTQRWWYEMGVSLYLEQSKLWHAKKLLEKCHAKFGDDYTSPRILVQMINKHLMAKNTKSAKYYTNILNDIVKKSGFGVQAKENHASTLTDEEEVLAFLNRNDLPSKKEYLRVISFYLHHGYVDEATQMMNLFLSKTPERDCKLVVKELQIYLQKIQLDKLDNAKAVQLIKKAYENFPQSKMNNNVRLMFFKAFANLGDYKTIANQLEVLENDSSPQQFGLLLKALLQAKHTEKAIELVKMMEQTQEASLNPQVKESFAPPITAHHYAALVRHSNILPKEFAIEALPERMSKLNVPFNSVFLNQVLLTYFYNKKYADCWDVINQMFDPSVSEDFYSTPLYRTVWVVYSNYYRTVSVPYNVYLVRDQAFKDEWNAARKLPPPQVSYRHVFSRMIQDSSTADPDLYKPIIQTAVRADDPSFLLAVLFTMHSTHDVALDSKVATYIANYCKRKGFRMEKPYTLFNCIETINQMAEESTTKEVFDEMSVEYSAFTLYLTSATLE